jgi:hypothetical protein
MSRLYLRPSGGTPGITPTQASEWDFFTGFTRVVPSPTKTNTAFANKAVTDATATANRDALAYQFVYPLQAGIAFATTQTIKGRVLALEGATASNLRSQAVIRVIASDGTTVRATLYAGDTTTGTANPTSEWATAATNRQMPRGTSVAVAANYTTVAGDYLVIEIGYRKHAAASTTGTIRLGDTTASTDLAENEATTTDGSTWIDFSVDLDPSAGTIFVPTDTFSGTTGQNLTAYSANYTVFDTAASPKISSAGRLYPATAGNNSHVVANQTPVSNEYDVRSTFRGLTAIANTEVGLLGRGDPVAYDFYSISITANQLATLYKVIGNTFTSLGQVSIAPGTTVDHSITLRIRDAAKAALYDGGTLLSSTNNDITAVGKAGIYMSEGVADTTGVHIDNFQAQDVQTAVSSTPISANDTQNVTAAADAASVGVTRTSADTQNITAAADTASLAAALSAADTQNVSQSESATYASPIAATDTQNVTQSETPVIAASRTAADTQNITAAADTGVVNTDRTVPDTQNVTAAADTASVGVTLSAADTQNVTQSENVSIQITFPVSATDSQNVTQSETAVAPSSRTVADTQNVTAAADTASLAATLSAADTQNVTQSESVSIAVTRTVADSQNVSQSEAALTAVTRTVADTQGIEDAADTASLSAALASADTQNVSQSESVDTQQSGGDASKSPNDSQNVTQSETVSIAVARTAADTQDVTQVEAPVVAATRSVADTQSVTPAESVALSLSKLAADTQNVTQSETTARGATIAASDAQGVGSTETSLLSALIAAVDASSITSSETATLPPLAKSAIDTASVSSTESVSTIGQLIASDVQGIGSIDLASMVELIILIPKLAIDSSLLSVVDAASIRQYLPPIEGTPVVGHGSAPRVPLAPGMLSEVGIGYPWVTASAGGLRVVKGRK